MSIAGDLRDAWRIAAAKPVGPGLRATHFTGGGTRIWATVTDEDYRGLLIGVQPEENLAHTVRAVAAASNALSSEIYHFNYDGQAVRGLLLWCNRLDLLEAFVGFCDPLVLRCLGGESLDSAFRVCFEEFRRLMSSPVATDPQQGVVGLLGELKVLSELVARRPEALGYWFYPALERHDFRNGSAALEVKTSLRGQNSRPIITVNSIDQLEPPSGGSLHLHWLRLERDPAGNIGIGTLMDEISTHVPADRASALRKRLRDNGIEAHGHDRFALQQREAYRVDGSFPRLTPSRLAGGKPDAGVGRVRYELDLSAAALFRCLPEDANKAVLAGVSGR